MSEQKKILLLQLMSNGDCLYATAVARQIKEDYPGCHLTWAIASFCKRIIENNPYVDDVLEIPNVSRDTATGIVRQLRKDLTETDKYGKFAEVVFTQIIDDNLANYDGCTRASIFRGYNRPITVPVTPVLRLSADEIRKAENFAASKKLGNFKNVILFEFAPQSGQVALTPAMALSIAERITRIKDTAIILSSAIKIEETSNILDGSSLTLRETAALTHYCTLLLGCSSGITWISTSDAGKSLPMVQILDPYAYWVNPISRDFQRFGNDVTRVIELYDNNAEKIVACVTDVLATDIETARKKYYSPLPLQFKTTRRSIYNMLVFLQFKAILKHIRINIGVYGWNPLLIKEIILGFITAPFKLVRNIVSKHMARKR
jgi:ADP-heptose:LPS heptosyltransferase